MGWDAVAIVVAITLWTNLKVKLDNMAGLSDKEDLLHLAQTTVLLILQVR